jgi:hypothetical protein
MEQSTTILNEAEANVTVTVFKYRNKIGKIFVKAVPYSVTKIEPYVIKQLLHLNMINMRFYGAEYNNIEHYEFGLSLCKIVRSSVIFLLPLFTLNFEIL